MARICLLIRFAFCIGQGPMPKLIPQTFFFGAPSVIYAQINSPKQFFPACIGFVDDGKMYTFDRKGQKAPDAVKESSDVQAEQGQAPKGRGSADAADAGGESELFSVPRETAVVVKLACKLHKAINRQETKEMHQSRRRLRWRT